MKKTPLAFALALALTTVGAAQAQSSVTLYGIADAGIQYTTGQDAAKTRLVSGIMEGSRFGFRGNEDLGGGWRTIFTLENRLELDTGAVSNRPPSGIQLPDRFYTAAGLGLPAPLAVLEANGTLRAIADNVATQTVGVNLPGRLFDRQAFVGLVTPFGAFLGGRQYTPAFEIVATFETMKNESSLAFGQVNGFPPPVDIRIENAASYRFLLGPWSGSLMYGLGEGSVATGRLIGTHVAYKSPAFSAGVAYQTRENERGEKSLTTFVVAGEAPIGPGKLSALYGKIDDDHPAGLSSLQTSLTPQVGPLIAQLIADGYRSALTQDADMYHVGYRIVSGPHTVSVAYNRYDDKQRRNLDVQSYGTVYSYALSKRTDLSAVLTRFDNNRNAQSAPGQQGFLGGVTSEAGQDALNVALGIRHRF